MSSRFPVLLLLCLSACNLDESSNVRLAAAPPRVDAGTTPATPDAGAPPQCVPTNGVCSDGTPCCTGFCDDNVYIDRLCHAPQAEGFYCQDASWCRSGLCVDGICALPPVDGGPQCFGGGQDCSGDESCCQGFCNQWVYTRTVCTAPVENGEYCQADRWCQSNHCVDGLCVAPGSCLAHGADCTVGDTCCNGFCDAAYLTGSCVPPREAGEVCDTHDQCREHKCTDGLCRMLECSAAQGDCYWDGECCTGFCTYAGATYAPGACASPQPAGTACEEARWCQSGVCLNGACL